MYTGDAKVYKKILELTQSGLEKRMKMFDECGGMDDEQDTIQVDSVFDAAQGLIDVCNKIPISDVEEMLLKGVLLLISEMNKTPQAMADMVSNMFDFGIKQMISDICESGIPDRLLEALRGIGLDADKKDSASDSINGQGEKLIAELMPEVTTLQ
jgi:hypothetical protein